MRSSDWSSDVCSSDLTTVNLIGAGFSNIVDKSLSASDLHDERVINELLRLSPSIHMTGRVAAEDILLGEHLIKGGSMVIAVLAAANRSEEHTSELQSLMRISYAVFCLKKKTKTTQTKVVDYHLQHT